jgi:UDP-glucose 4-epimerase
MSILVTGSSGTIGTRLCERLLSEGRDVIGADWVDNAWQPAVQAITKRTDLRHLEELNALPDGIDTIVHLGAHARVYDLVLDPARALENLVTLFNTLEFARTRGIKKFMFASSRESYGNIRPTDFPQAVSGERVAVSAEGKDPATRHPLAASRFFREDMVRVEHCESPYTASKVGGEALVHSYMRCYGVGAVIFRFSNVYGMYDSSDRVIPLFLRRARKNEPLTVFGAEKCLDFTYIDDNVDGIVRCIDRFDQVAGQTFNLGNGEGTTILALAETIKKLLGSASEIVPAPSRTGEVTHYVANIDNARTRLGYDPKTKFAEGIVKTVEWYSAHPEA